MSRAASELAHLFRALKAPAAARAWPVLAERAREQQWSYDRFAEALLSTEVAARDSHGGDGRIKAAASPPARPWRSSTSPSALGQEDRRRASRAARLPARARERDPARAARSWFTLHLRSHWLSRRSKPASGTSILKPFRHVNRA